ncbi:hypothetical protein AB0M94_07730 [Streptomyces xanthochromogenes]|uniref:hypothetical protein n=1 Tax=Streptomyces xanthochromogenes TaxID=67384 RepID=UPI003437C884
MFRKSKRLCASQPDASASIDWRRLTGEQIGIFVGRHAVIGFLTGAASAVGAFLVHTMLG